MPSPLVLTSTQVTVIESVDALLSQALNSGVVDPGNNQLVPPVPPVQNYGQVSIAIQEQAQAAVRSGFSALLSALNYTPTPSGASGTITLAALTGGGTQGSITVVNGIITAFTNPT